jgi:hypothetical protein
MDKPSTAPPTPEEARTRIQRVEELASSDAPMEELAAAVKAVHSGCAVKVVTVGPGKRMFRAVGVKERPVHKSRVSYPPAHLAPLGRANDIGQSLFYASIADSPGPEGRSNILACAWESKAEDGDLLAIGEWVAIETLPLYPFGFQALQMNTMLRGNQPWIRQSTPEDAMEVINAWESEVFTRVVKPGDERQYRISVALTKYALDIRAEMGDTDRVSGIVFPAVATQLNSDNICLTPEAADNGLALLGVRILDAKNMHLFGDQEERPEEGAVGIAEVTFHDTSYPCNGRDEIKWPKRWIMRSIFTEI